MCVYECERDFFVSSKRREAATIKKIALLIDLFSRITEKPQTEIVHVEAQINI